MKKLFEEILIRLKIFWFQVVLKHETKQLTEFDLMHDSRISNDA